MCVILFVCSCIIFLLFCFYHFCLCLCYSYYGAAWIRVILICWCVVVVRCVCLFIMCLVLVCLFACVLVILVLCVCILVILIFLFGVLLLLVSFVLPLSRCFFQQFLYFCFSYMFCLYSCAYPLLRGCVSWCLCVFYYLFAWFTVLLVCVLFLLLFVCVLAVLICCWCVVASPCVCMLNI